MLWKVKKDSKTSIIVGSTHFFPYSFKKGLYKYISNSQGVVVEGPLDDDSLKVIAEKGLCMKHEPPLIDFFNRQEIQEISRVLYGFDNLTSMGSLFSETLTDISKNFSSHIVEDTLQTGSYWLAFFRIWQLFLDRYINIYYMDRDAVDIARQLGKETYYLEKIQEQVDALDKVPTEKIVRFLKSIKGWQDYFSRTMELYLKGDLQSLMKHYIVFPTFCKSIIDDRDPIFADRLIPYLEMGDMFIMVGVVHIDGVKNCLIKHGYSFE